MYGYLAESEDVFRDINIAELDKDTIQSRILLKRASSDFLYSKNYTRDLQYWYCIGTRLFLLQINDLPSVISSQVRLFADDCLMYRPIRSKALQRDLDSLERWSNAWGMKFNAKKCQVMSIASRKSHPAYLYNLCGHILSIVQVANYLWITLTDELSWSSHVHSIHSHANSTLGFLRRNLWHCPAKLKETVYIMLVRSTLEYAASI